MVLRFSKACKNKLNKWQGQLLGLSLGLQNVTHREHKDRNTEKAITEDPLITILIEH